MQRCWHWLKHEFHAVLPPTIFFLIAFHIVVIDRRLMLREYGLPISANLPLCPRAPRLLHAAFCCLSGHAQARWASQVRTVDS